MPARVAMRAAVAVAGALVVLASAGARGAGATSNLRAVAPGRTQMIGAAVRGGFVAPLLGSSALATPTGLQARAALLILQGPAKVLYAYNANAELSVASTTKLMTAWVAIHREPPSATLVEQPYVAVPGESIAPVPPGARLSLRDMLRAMLLPSGNNVAYSLALDLAGSVDGFVAQMNAAAAALHLGRSHYTTPIGLDTPPGNYSTATDLALLARLLMRSPLVRGIVAQPSARLADGIVVDNRNDLVGTYPWIVGMKTGTTTAAGQCLVAAARLDGVRLISVVLGAPTKAARDADTLALLRYGLSLYRGASISVRGRVYASVPVTGRTRPARLVATRSLRLVIARSVALHVTLRLPRHLTGPIRAGRSEGSLLVSENGRAVTSVALLTAARVPPPRPSQPSVHIAAVAWYAGGGGIVFLVVVGCSLPSMRRRTARSAAPGLHP